MCTRHLIYGSGGLKGSPNLMLSIVRGIATKFHCCGGSHLVHQLQWLALFMMLVAFIIIVLFLIFFFSLFLVVIHVPFTFGFWPLFMVLLILVPNYCSCSLLWLLIVVQTSFLSWFLNIIHVLFTFVPDYCSCSFLLSF